MPLPGDKRIAVYEQIARQTLLGYLGSGPGQDGFVLESSNLTAAKFFDREDRYLRERDVYRVLAGKSIDQIAGHNVPRLIRAIDSIFVLELTIVERPFLLDFAGAKLPHEVPDFEAHVIEQHHAHLRELFDSRWTDAIQVAEMFRIATGFTLLDIHPGNIAFADE